MKDEYELGHDIESVRVYPVGNCQFFGVSGHVDGIRIANRAEVKPEIQREEVLRILLSENCPIDIIMALKPTACYVKLIERLRNDCDKENTSLKNGNKTN